MHELLPLVLLVGILGLAVGLINLWRTFTMSDGTDALTKAVGDLTTAVNTETATIATEATAIADNTAATLDNAKQISTLIADLSNSGDPAAKAAAAKIEALVTQINTNVAAAAASGQAISQSSATVKSTTAAAVQAISALPAPPAPLVINGTFADPVVGQPYTGSVSASGGVGDLTITATGLPDGLSCDAAGNVTGTPTTDGINDAEFTVTDSTGATATLDASIDVDPAAAPGPPAPPSPPPPPAPPPTVVVDTSGVPAQAAINVAFTGTVTVDSGVAPVNFSIDSGALPTGLSLASGGKITGTATVLGPFTADVQATDANGDTGNGTVAITVVDPDAPPAPAPDPTDET